MKKILFLSAISFLMISCTPKNSAFRYFDKGDIEANATRYTKKADIISNNQVDITFMATYLNKLNPRLDEKEDSFLVYVYFSNLENQDIQSNNYEILLNGKVPTYIEKLEKDDENYKNMMLRNFWGTYYLVKFNNQELVSKLNIVLKPKSNDATLIFEKY
ncbi:hypothetical protein [Aliarcobacter vitoriensis]|uniref:Lipoprotein n=1 Tax=Aliarcobacter vitoriensis TaxID=2011099 RepID=A0A366MUP3_9BACT|nr:hypothetical protein [Aliarcobacter vitoriensis]RBQ29965.1 hypothetical protein CRU91_01410 [Aliarcobacter vitoriensis]RBQ31968.1 hypothetical protein CRU92_04150 [Arcobacter sp. FW59]